MTLAEHVGHIEQRHHTFLKGLLPRLEGLVRGAIGEAGVRHAGSLSSLELKLDSLRKVLEHHLRTEERTVFPLIRELDACVQRGEAFPRLGAISPLLDHLGYEHEMVGEMLSEIRQLMSACLVLGGAAGEAARSLREAIQALDDDLREHVHQENDILFPRVAELDDPAQHDGATRNGNRASGLARGTCGGAERCVQ